MTTIDSSLLSCVGASEQLCRALEEGKFTLQVSKDDAVVVGSDGARIFRVTKDGVDQALLKSIFEKNIALQTWVGECRATARANHGNCNASKAYVGTPELFGFQDKDGKVHVKVEKRHETEGGKKEKHAGYTPFASVNDELYRACRIAMEQFNGQELEEKDSALAMVQLGAQLRFDEKSQKHVAAPEKEETKTWHDVTAYKKPTVESTVETVESKEGKHHHHKKHK
jgi:hypothetical protein